MLRSAKGMGAAEGLGEEVPPGTTTLPGDGVFTAGSAIQPVKVRSRARARAGAINFFTNFIFCFLAFRPVAFYRSRIAACGFYHSRAAALW